ncbi:MAG TPA: C25 family cysteine peptidase, partial [Pyrinomonadaceae bacterium]|nr:C25 family cysteine peptidase [Pyrinomonadaceae bacterium]
GALSGSKLVSMNKTFDIDTSLLKEGSNTLVFTAVKGLQLFDSVNVNFARKFQAEQNRLMFYTDFYRVNNLTGFTSPNVRVFDLTNPDNPILVSNLTAQAEGSGYIVRIPANRPRVMFATADEAFFQADSLIENIPSTLSTTAHNADMVIISHKSLLTPANEWANYRRGDGFSVEVVEIEDVYDEFSFGVSSAYAIRDFLEYAKSNWQTPPRYVLFIGDSSYDAKNYIGFGNLNFVPTKIIDTVYTETGSDEALADFNDDGLAEIAVGRIPARTVQEVTDALNKTKSFEQSLPQAINRGTLCVSDLPVGYDFEALCGRVMSELPDTFPKATLNRGVEDSRGKLLSQLNSGKYLVNYSGHGTTAAWVSNGFFSRNDVEPMTNGNNLTIFTMLTCLNGYFIHPVNNGLSESLLKKSNGGAVAAWSSTGLTTPDIQEVMARRFFKQLGIGTMNRIGDLITDSKTVVTGGRDVRLSWVLLGDPTLKVR